MKRVGECKRCGKCCTHIGFVNKNVPGFDEWATARGLDFTYEENNTIARIILHNVCPHYVEVGENRGCDLHGTRDKPDVCVAFPVVKEHLLEGCGFSFVDEEA